jgi:hypothetical protein
VVIREFPQRVDAEMAHGALKARGLESLISADDAGRQYVGIIGPVRLLVRRDEAQLARRILRLSN